MMSAPRRDSSDRGHRDLALILVLAVIFAIPLFLVAGFLLSGGYSN
jgi:hypothetical protein